MADAASADRRNGARASSLVRKKPSLQEEQKMVVVNLHGKAHWKGEVSAATGSTSLIEQVESKVFSIHKAFLCFYSPFFAKIFLRDSVAGVGMYGVNHAAFAIFVHWLYYQDLESLDVQPVFDDMIRVWGLAERFEVPVLQDSAVEWLKAKVLLNPPMERLREVPFGELLKLAQKHEVAGLTDWLRDILVDTKDERRAAIMLDYASPDMMKSVIMRKIEIANGRGPSASDHPARNDRFPLDVSPSPEI